MEPRKGIDYVGIVVSFFCHDGEGNFLFSKRGIRCRDEHGTWDAGGGGLELHDNVLDTLKREIAEEYCADILEHEFLGYSEAHREHEGEKTHWIALDFKVRVNRKSVRNGEPHKFDEIGWFRLDALPAPLHSQLPYILKKYAGRLA
ncbi:MAG TPA: NUDIX domain-containing protein [Candidatus Paceibacterota bacterium]|jgi:8-oxo-dGTP pyrophosphatase MutT (NUDIX family)